VDADQSNDAQTLAKAEYRDFVAKQLDTLSSDERGELKVLTVKPDKHESTMADLLRECQLSKRQAFYLTQRTSNLIK
jgi:hypothetical protein